MHAGCLNSGSTMRSPTRDLRVQRLTGSAKVQRRREKKKSHNLPFPCGVLIPHSFPLPLLHCLCLEDFPSLRFRLGGPHLLLFVLRSSLVCLQTMSISAHQDAPCSFVGSPFEEFFHMGRAAQSLNMMSTHPSPDNP